MRLEFPLTFRATGTRGRTQGKLRVQALERVQEAGQVLSRTLCRSRHHHASRVLSQHVFGPAVQGGESRMGQGAGFGSKTSCANKEASATTGLGAGLE